MLCAFSSLLTQSLHRGIKELYKWLEITATMGGLQANCSRSIISSSRLIQWHWPEGSSPPSAAAQQRAAARSAAAPGPQRRRGGRICKLTYIMARVTSLRPHSRTGTAPTAPGTARPKSSASARDGARATSPPFATMYIRPADLQTAKSVMQYWLDRSHTG